MTLTSVRSSMDKKTLVQTSKFLSLVLRHEPARAGLTLDDAGWVGVDELLDGLCRAGHPLSRDELIAIVTSSDKQRFALSDDTSKIRANQGHTVAVELGYTPATPPEVLYHGTIAEVLHLIRADGLRKMARHHVHLSADDETARRVGSRRGRPVILRVYAARMHADNYPFFLAANGVWLTDHVPPAFIDPGDHA